MENLPTDPLSLLKMLYAAAGWVGALVGGVFLAVNLYKTGPAQALLVKFGLPERYTWDALSIWPQRGVVFSASLLGAALVAVLAGVAWPVALGGALPVALAAAAAHKLSKVAGQALNGVMVKVPLYDGSAVQKMVAVVLPTGEKKP